MIKICYELKATDNEGTKTKGGLDVSKVNTPTELLNEITCAVAILELDRDRLVKYAAEAIGVTEDQMEAILQTNVVDAKERYKKDSKEIEEEEHE